jgi:Tfp pilus assembly protein PilZ
MDSRRTFYRIPKQFPVTFRRSRGEASRGLSTTISCEGASIRVRNDDANQMERGERLNVGLVVNGDKLTLPAVVAWVRPHCRQSSVVGLKLMLPLADAASRMAYAEWIVAETRSIPAKRPRRRADPHNSVVRVSLSPAQRMALRQAG